MKTIRLLAGVLVSVSTSFAAPQVPLGVAMVGNSTGSVTLAWYRGTNADASAWNVFASDKTNGVFAKVASVKERSVTLGGLAAGATNFYKISAVGADGESAMSPMAMGFTAMPCAGAPFPVKVAKNMCVSLGAVVVCGEKPLAGSVSNLVDGSDATGCRLRRAAEVKIKLNADVSIADAEYLLVHFRTDCGPNDWSNDTFARTLKRYVVTESRDSTDGKDGTWSEVVSGTNTLLDSVIVIPNHQPKWIGVRSSYGPKDEVPKADDRRLHPGDLILARLDVFRSAPAGERNDYWIFTGDSLVVQDMPASTDKERASLFSDLIRKQHPDRYPIVVHAARGGEMLKDTKFRMQEVLAAVSPAGTKTPVATVVCWESGFNDVGVGGSLWLGDHLIKSYEAARQMCVSNGLVMVPVRIEFSTGYLDMATLEPAKDNIFYNTLAVNLAGVDVFCRSAAPYAFNPETQLPFADYWSYTRKNYASVLVKDGVHHTKAGSDGINALWADVAGKMVYSQAR